MIIIRTSGHVKSSFISIHSRLYNIGSLKYSSALRHYGHIHRPLPYQQRLSSTNGIASIQLESDFLSNTHLTSTRFTSSNAAQRAIDVASKTLTCQSSTETIASSGKEDEVKAKKNSVKTQPFYAPYLALTKPRLTALIVLSSMSSYALSPNDAALSQLLFLTIGTALCSGSANAINMAREYRYDALMTRTRLRPVVRGLLSPAKAYYFAAASGALGVSALYLGVNPTVAALGAANIYLYGGLYTTLKRKSISNTWVGAVVGAIPPLMGWAASSSLTDPGAWMLAALLYAWQFPHFMALSHNIRYEYMNAGYVMACWTNPAMNARVALRYSLWMFPICIGLSYFNVTDWVFAFDSAILNSWLVFEAFKFWKEQRYNTTPLNELTKAASSSSGSARRLFWGSVLHLPGILVLAMIHKKGQWDWLFAHDQNNVNYERF